MLAVDPATNAIVDRLAITDGAPGDLLVAFGSVWLELGLQDTIERLPLSALTIAR